MFKRIVVPLDGSKDAERALHPAKALADQAGVPVELVTTPVGGVAAWPRKYLHEAARRVELDDARVRAGKASLQHLLDEITAEEETLVCMTSHGHGAAYEAVFGHTAKDLIVHTRAPFLVVGPHADLAASWRADRIIVCTDGSDTAGAIVPVVADWTQALGATACVLQVVRPEAQELAANTGGDVIEANVVRAIAEELGDGTAVDWDVLHDDHTARAIVDFADKTPGSLIAMATHGRTGFARMTVGSVAGAVLQHAACPVLVVRPANLRDD
jgi:nucleotide-binding universal stress UspA family protein